MEDYKQQLGQLAELLVAIQKWHKLDEAKEFVRNLRITHDRLSETVGQRLWCIDDDSPDRRDLAYSAFQLTQIVIDRETTVPLPIILRRLEVYYSELINPTFTAGQPIVFRDNLPRQSAAEQIKMMRNIGLSHSLFVLEVQPVDPDTANGPIPHHQMIRIRRQNDDGSSQAYGSYWMTMEQYEAEAQQEGCAFTPLTRATWISGIWFKPKI